MDFVSKISHKLKLTHFQFLSDVFEAKLIAKHITNNLLINEVYIFQSFKMKIPVLSVCDHFYAVFFKNFLFYLHISSTILKRFRGKYLWEVNSIVYQR
jgi:hypothetical protein